MRKLILTAALAALAAPAVAQECAPYEQIADLLRHEHGERPVFHAMTRLPQGVMLRSELFLDVADGSWTLLVIGASGMACLAAHGTNGRLSDVLDIVPEGTAL